MAGDLFKTFSACLVLTLSAIACITLLVIAIHLIYICLFHQHKKNAAKILYIFMSITIVAIIVFFITGLLIFLVILQILLHLLHYNHFMGHSYYNSLETMSYLIAALDTFAHLCVVLLFIARFDRTFRKGVHIVRVRTLSRVLYAVLFILFVLSVAIIWLIITHYKSHTIIICEIIWELAVEIMCIWILYLFVSRLYHLLKSTFTPFTRPQHELHRSPPLKAMSPSEIAAIEGAADLVGVMNKMTLLVTFAVLMSTLSVIGNISVEVHALKTTDKRDIDTHILWADALPLLDIVVTSFMLYFQFSFTDRYYQKYLGKLDRWMLGTCLLFLEYFEPKITTNEQLI